MVSRNPLNGVVPPFSSAAGRADWQTHHPDTVLQRRGCTPHHSIGSAERITGIGKVEWLIVDDGSTDRTVEVARAHGVDHIVSLPRHQGLARGVRRAGLQACLQAGADIIVNTDADNQYNAEDIPRLIQPILERKAEIVVGTRPIKDIEHFSTLKKMLQKLGSWFIRLVSRTDIPMRPADSGP